jgi:hypothetical protein
MSISKYGLAIIDSKMIELQLRDGWGGRAVARALSCFPGTNREEIKRHSGRSGSAAQDTNKCFEILLTDMASINQTSPEVFVQKT